MWAVVPFLPFYPAVKMQLLAIDFKNMNPIAKQTFQTVCKICEHLRGR
jgi:hypothetical protein